GQVRKAIGRELWRGLGRRRDAGESPCFCFRPQGREFLPDRNLFLDFAAPEIQGSRNCQGSTRAFPMVFEGRPAVCSRVGIRASARRGRGKSRGCSKQHEGRKLVYVELKFKKEVRVSDQSCLRKRSFIRP